jgi:hypothetical protein
MNTLHFLVVSEGFGPVPPGQKKRETDRLIEKIRENGFANDQLPRSAVFGEMLPFPKKKDPFRSPGATC